MKQTFMNNSFPNDQIILALKNSKKKITSLAYSIVTKCNLSITKNPLKISFAGI